MIRKLTKSMILFALESRKEPGGLLMNSVWYSRGLRVPCVRIPIHLQGYPVVWMPNDSAPARSSRRIHKIQNCPN